MYALGKYISALEPPTNPNQPNDLTARGEQVFGRAGCAGCHTPPLYTNNKLVAVDGFTPFAHPNAPPAEDVMAREAGTRSRTRAADTERDRLLQSAVAQRTCGTATRWSTPGSIASLEEWFDPARLRDDYLSKGWNPPDTKTRAIPGHIFGLTLPAEDKAALIAFLRTL